MDSHKIDNPWKGLNFYTEGEILYGRNAEILSLSHYIFNNTQTVLYGRSGIGKSSIINAGIFPKARLEGMMPVSIRLKHDDATDYLDQIRRAIKDSGIMMKALLASVNGEKNETLWEFMHRHIFCDHNSESRVPLLVFDQFEEIFTLQKNENIKREFFRQLGDLLNDVKPSYIVEYENQLRRDLSSGQETKIVSSGTFKGLSLKLNVKRPADEEQLGYVEQPLYHIVFAMREDFLSSLEYYASSIPVMKDNRFGLLPINEEQAADIIRLPRMGLVNDEVTKLIIQQVTGRNDFELDGKPEIEVDSAVLSLFLSRLYIKKSATEEQITKDLVIRYSGHIIHDFYLESISSNEQENEIIRAETVDILEDQLLTREGRRNNVSRSDLLAQGISYEELYVLVEKRKLLRQFNHGNDIRIEYIHDILCPIVKERIEQRELLRQQEIELQRQEDEKQRLQEEEEKKRLEIEQKAAREKAELEAAALRVKRRNRQIYIVSVTILLIICLGITYYYFANNYTYKSYYADFDRVNGWPIGVGCELDEASMARSPLYYCLSHKGSKSPILQLLGIKVDEDVFTDIEVMSSNPRLPKKSRVNSLELVDMESNDQKALAYNELLSQIHKIHFVAGEGNKIEKEVAMNENDSTLFVITYFHINSSEMWGSFITPSGQSMQIRDKEGIDRMKISLDSLGRRVSLMYYDINGVCQPIRDDVCGFAWKYGEKIEKCYLLDQFNLPKSKGYNLVITQIDNGCASTHYRYVSSLDDDMGIEALGPDGFSKIVAKSDSLKMYISENNKQFSTKIIKKDDRGNVLSEIVHNNLSSILPTIIKYEYNKDGYLTKVEKLVSQDVPFAIKDSDVYLYEWDYLEDRKIKEVRRSKMGITYQHAIKFDQKATTETLEDNRNGKNIYIVKIDSTFNDGYSTSYYGRNAIPINHKVAIDLDGDSILLHRMRCVVKENAEYQYFYIYDGFEKKAPVVKDEFFKLLSYYCKVTERDVNHNITSCQKLDETGNIIKSMMYFVSNGHVIGRAAKGIDGTPVRCNKWEEEGLLYYKIYYNVDFYNKFVGIKAINEWGQSSIFYDPIYGGIDVIYKDFKGFEIKCQWNPRILRPYKQAISRQSTNISDVYYPYLHLLSKASCLYKAGLKDGDRIVEFGRWRLGDSNESFKNEWSLWLSSNEPVRIKILRLLSDGTVMRIGKRIECPSDSKELQEYHILPVLNEEYEYLSKKSMIK